MHMIGRDFVHEWPWLLQHQGYVDHSCRSFLEELSTSGILCGESLRLSHCTCWPKLFLIRSCRLKRPCTQGSACLYWQREFISEGVLLEVRILPFIGWSYCSFLHVHVVQVKSPPHRALHACNSDVASLSHRVFEDFRGLKLLLICSCSPCPNGVQTPPHRALHSCNRDGASLSQRNLGWADSLAEVIVNLFMFALSEWRVLRTESRGIAHPQSLKVWKVWKFEPLCWILLLTASNFQTFQTVKLFKFFKVWKGRQTPTSHHLQTLKVWKVWKVWKFEKFEKFESLKPTNFQTFKLSTFEKFESLKSLKVWKVWKFESSNPSVWCDVLCWVVVVAAFAALLFVVLCSVGWWRCPFSCRRSMW